MEKLLENIRARRPLVHAITNHVSANDVANAILAIGGMPIMAESLEEVSEIAEQADALVLNLGILTREKLDSMIIAGKAANRKNIPVVLDPVGCMSSFFRKNAVDTLLREIRFSVIKGNASEMEYIFNADSRFAENERFRGRGVDSGGSRSRARLCTIVSGVAKKYRCIAVLTGETDFVADERTIYSVQNSSEALQKITGIGCILAGMLGVFLGAAEDAPLPAALAATAMLSIAGELSEESALFPNASASIRVALIDHLATITARTLNDCAKIRREKSLRERLRLYAITPEYRREQEESYLQKIEEAMKAGIGTLQLREKNLPMEELIALGKKIKSLADRYDVLFIVNDHPAAAGVIEADGVHLGETDMCIDEARALLGNVIIGLSTHNRAEAIEAERKGADYIGVGAVYATQSKHDTVAISEDELYAVGEAIAIPSVAIGGIHQGNMARLKDKKLTGVAMISAIFEAEDMSKAVRTMLEELDTWKRTEK